MEAQAPDAAGEAASELPVALCRALKTRTSSGNGWALVIDECPFCRRSHAHGGGTGTRPAYGHRVAHCVDRADRAAYSLQPADGAR